MVSLIVGIISGILTTVIILSAKSFFYKVLVPWYLKVRYKGVDLSGKWMAIKEDYTFTIEIKQSANDLDGILVVSYNPHVLADTTKNETLELALAKF